MKKIKLSDYNETVTSGGKEYVYNFYTGAIIEFENGQKLELEKMSKEETDFLEKKGFVVGETVDEAKRLEFSYLSNKFDKSSLGLTLCTTLECNFDCPYCYEGRDKNKRTMSVAVLEKISGFVASKIKKDNIKSVYVNILGGEALLKLDVLKSALEKLDGLCAEKNIPVKTTLITNGYCLDEAIPYLDMPRSIQTVQITFDGFGESHDKMRHTAAGEGSFDKIFDNMVLALGKGVNVAVRYNLTAANMADAGKFIEKVGGLEKKPFVYFGHVTEYAGMEACQSVSCMSRVEYSKADLELIRYALSKGIKTDYMPFGFGNHCTADTVNGFTIDPDGDIYKCWNHVGKKEFSCGSIMAETPEDIISDENKYYCYTMENPFRSSCAQCKFMPVCMGGCPVERLGGTKRCSKYKFQAMEFVKLYAEESSR